jgi:thioredoxin 2
MSPGPTFLFRCASCHTKNRIPGSQAGKTGKCGKCGAALDTRALLTRQPVVVSDANFLEMILHSPLPALVDCWAPWCGACKMLTSVLQEMAAEYAGRLRIGKLNVESNPVTASAYNTLSLPTLLLFDGGVLKETLVGALPKSEIVRAVQPYLF